MFHCPAKSRRALLKAALVCGLVMGWTVACLSAQPLVPSQGLMVLHSRSDQFVVLGALPGSALGPPSLSLIETNHLQMDPTLLVLTCERVKTVLLHELGLSDTWSGRIQINVRGGLRPTEPVVIESHWNPGGWRYQIVVPGQLERTRLMRALTRALLLEVANRGNTSQRPAEIPLWLEEGLAKHLLALHGDSLIPEIRTLTSVMQAAHPDVFTEARRQLRGRHLVSFADLCMARPDQFNAEQWEAFRCTAQLLVAELLYLPEGRACLQGFLRQLPGYLNSQIALLRGYAPHFQTMLDAEKWWAVVWMNFTGRERLMRFSVDHGLRQIEEILAPAIAVRLGTNAVPGRKELPLREVIANTDFAQHEQAVALATQQLQLLQVTAPVELARLISDHRQALLTYLRRRTEYSSKTSSKGADAKLATKEVLERLDMLEVIRLDIVRLDAAAAADPAGR
ncbi:MAG: hypothetical protein HZA92_18940 [Verrucomicrobia bacterium]|nr:hypothetical protein [Verrucomicrobiota bacterium]